MSSDFFAGLKPWPEPSLMLTDEEINEIAEPIGFGYGNRHVNIYALSRRIERTVAQRIVTRLEGACGATSLPPVVIKNLFLERVQ